MSVLGSGQFTLIENVVVSMGWNFYYLEQFWKFWGLRKLISLLGIELGSFRLHIATLLTSASRES
jgi:hypothetical protein